MKWFQHESGLDLDPGLNRVKDVLGLEGYGAFWVINEIICRTIEDGTQAACTFSLETWRGFLRFSKKKCKKFLDFFQKANVFSIHFDKNDPEMVSISAPKLLYLLDNATQAKKREANTDKSTSKKLRRNFALEKEKEEDLDKEEEKTPPSPPAAPAMPVTPPLEERAPQAAACGGECVIPEIVCESSSKPESSTAKKSKPGKEPEILPKDFDIFWKAYPRKEGKKAALAAWRKAKDKPSLEVILAAVERSQNNFQWQKEGGRFIPHPSTWLNQGRWDDQETQIEVTFTQMPKTKEENTAFIIEQTNEWLKERDEFERRLGIRGGKRIEHKVGLGGAAPPVSALA